jgi:elongation factor Ts
MILTKGARENRKRSRKSSSKRRTRRNQLPIPVALVKELREKSGAGIMECRNVLEECGGDMEKSLGMLRERGLARAEKKAHRSTTQGLVEAYIHPGGRIGAMVEVDCESDFVARTDEFKEMAHDLVLQVAATDPQFLSPADMPPGNDSEPREVCLLLQPFIKDEGKTVEELIKDTIARTGENIRVKRFIRFQLGE